MAGHVVLGLLAAYGAFCMLWAVFGWLLPGLRGCVLVCFGQPEVETFAKYKWLRDAGILECPLLVISEEATDTPDMEICTGKDLLSRLEMERKRFDGTGNGDHSGNH